MVATTLSQSILAGMDPSTLRNIQDIQDGQEYTKTGMDSSPTTGWGAAGRLANALAGAYITNTSTSDLAKTLAAGKKSAGDTLLAALTPQAKIPSGAPTLSDGTPRSSYAPAAQSITPQTPIAPATASADVPPAAGSPNAQVANRFPAEMSPPGTVPETVPEPLDTAQWPAGPKGAPPDTSGVAAISNAMQPRGIRNNNPLNIEDGPFTRSQPGYAGSDGRFAKFETPEHGAAAANALLDTYNDKHGLNTVAGIVGRWAPTSDGNNVSAYAADVAGRLGIDPNAPVPPEKRQQLIAAMAQHENGRAAPGTVDAAQAPYKVAGPATAAPKADAAEADPTAGLGVSQLLQVLHHPYASDEEKALASKLLVQKLTPKEDEFASTREGRVFNKRTGEFKQDANAPAADPYGGLQGAELMSAVKQQNPALAAQAQAVIEGRTPYPTGSRLNPQQQQLKELVTQIDPTFEAGTSRARMKMQGDLAASGNSNMGGILSNGKSSFQHLADLSDKMSDLGNYNGPDIPGGAAIAAAGNYVGNALLPTAKTSAKQTAFNQNALKYGEESTKFYSGTGGGEAERMNALKTLNPQYTSADQHAAFLRTEKGLMLDRLTEKERQVRDVMGQDYLDKHPIMTPELQAQVKRIDDNVAKLEGTATTDDAATKKTATPAAAAAPDATPDRAAVEAELRKRGLIK